MKNDRKMYAILSRVEWIDKCNQLGFARPMMILNGEIIEEIDNSEFSESYFIYNGQRYSLLKDMSIVDEWDNLVVTHLVDEKEIENIFGTDLDEGVLSYLEAKTDEINLIYYDIEADGFLVESVTYEELEKIISKSDNYELVPINEQKLLETKKIEFIDNSSEKVLENLSSLVGMEEIKKEIDKLSKISKYNHLVFEGNLNAKLDELYSRNCNMLIVGNSGTGKTTIANIIADLYYKLGFVSSDKVIYTLPSSFIAGYVGQSEGKTKELIESAKGGVIIIDEVYGLTQGETNFSEKVINIIIGEMNKSANSSSSFEDKKDKVTFILMGYEREMENFIKFNSGFTSRIPNKFHIKKYTKEQLLDIFINGFKKSNNKFVLEDIVLETVLELFEKAMIDDDFGNARFAENINRVIYEQHKVNVIESGLIEDFKIKAEDIPESILDLLNVNKKNKICGFSI